MFKTHKLLNNYLGYKMIIHVLNFLIPKIILGIRKLRTLIFILS
jgi:hypothetical protein